MDYEACRTGCVEDCGNIQTLRGDWSVARGNESSCMVTPTEGCFCNGGTVLHHGQCVSREACSQCVDNRGHTYTVRHMRRPAKHHWMCEGMIQNLNQLLIYIYTIDSNRATKVKCAVSTLWCLVWPDMAIKRNMVCFCFYSICRVGYQMRTHVWFACVWTNNTSTAPPGPAMISNVNTLLAHSSFALHLQYLCFSRFTKGVCVYVCVCCSSSVRTLWDLEGEERIQVLPRVWVWYVKKKKLLLLLLSWHFYFHIH